MEFTLDVKEKTLSLSEGIAVWTWKDPTLGEYKAYNYRLERAAAVYKVLEAGRLAFTSGQADYQGAADQVGKLWDESQVAASRLLKVVQESSRWFEGILSPDDGDQINKAFDGHLDQHLAMVRAWLRTFEIAEEILGNSSRGLSESSEQEPPKIAENAPSSGTHQTEELSGPESVETKDVAAPVPSAP